jgi:hypothetical protein
MDGYLIGQSNWLVNYAERQHAGLRVGTAIAEGTANFLVNRRMSNASRYGGHDEAVICYSRFVTLSITAPSVLTWGNISGHPTIQSRQWP